MLAGIEKKDDYFAKLHCQELLSLIKLSKGTKGNVQLVGIAPEPKLKWISFYNSNLLNN